MIILAIALGGFLGGILRYLLSKTLPALWGTFAANAAACLLLGYASAASLSPAVTALLGTGIAGALSTWSTLAKELGGLGKSRSYRRLGVYLVGTVLVGVACVMLGRAL
ncbi:fluoride efflux transporter FluC [Corynebacterium vitaeruminis]|uniref:fluoride efflux transporter FluC n=1 Tax=Corynebacterium vitaeruminis TaxID=38305 RepID=UPI0028AD5224|nr:CrcB family protein [Corynebacterium vitaeruminis]